MGTGDRPGQPCRRPRPSPRRSVHRARCRLAACVAFAITSLERYEFPRARIAADRVAVASTKAADVMAAAVQTPEKIDLAKVLSSLREMAEEGSKLMPVSNDMLPEPPPICTPPTTLLLESAQIASPFGEM